MPRYMILMQEDDHAWENLSLEQKQKIMEQYFAWAEELRSGGHMRGGEALARGGRILRTVLQQLPSPPDRVLRREHPHRR